MPDDERTFDQYDREVFQAQCERLRQAGFAALDELKPELAKCVTIQDIEAWCERVNALTREIMARPN
jgi:hypothetical protein